MIVRNTLRQKLSIKFNISDEGVTNLLNRWSDDHFAEFEVIDGLNQHKDGLNYWQWIKKNKLGQGNPTNESL